MKQIKLYFSILLLLSTISCTSIDSNAKPFSIIVLPDTQIYTLKHPNQFIEQTRWIKSQIDPLNIACVIHEGDVTHQKSEREWATANQAMGQLDGLAPYCVAIGNHDLGPRDQRLKGPSCLVFQLHRVASSRRCYVGVATQI